MTVSRPEKQTALVIGRETVKPGERRKIEIPVARLPSQDFLSLPISVIHGRKPGPRLWLSAALHGDEVNGIEIIRRVLGGIPRRRLKGSLLAVPIVNMFGFLYQTRELPDRRDLNRSFPGSPRGSLASRLAHLFIQEVVAHCSHGIDFHTASHHRSNLPQVRANLEDPETLRCARAFGAPLLLHSKLRDGSLRATVSKQGKAVLVYEGGEALRFNKGAIEMAVAGTQRVLQALGMLDDCAEDPVRTPRKAQSSSWVRARRGGIFRSSTRLGAEVAAKQELGVISDAFGENRIRVRAPFPGLVIGISLNPLTYQGDALVHLARLDDESD